MTIPCPVCQKLTLKEIQGKKVKSRFKNLRLMAGIKDSGILVQCDQCHCYWEITVLKESNRSIIEPVMADEIVDAAPKPDTRKNTDLEKYLKSNGWHKVFTEDKEFIGWWHPGVSPLSGRVYPPWAAQIIQNGIDDFTYSHIKH